MTNQQLPLKLDDLMEMLKSMKDQRRLVKEEHIKVLAHASELEKAIHALDQSIAPLARLLGQEDVSLDSARDWTAQAHADAAETVMHQRDRRWRIAELIEELKAVGHPLPPDERQQYTALHSALKRRPKTFHRVERGRWVLVGSQAEKDADKDGANKMFRNSD